MDRRAISPLVGTVLLVALTVAFAASVGGLLVQSGTDQEVSAVRIAASADASSDTLSMTHEGGATLDPDALSMKVTVDGVALNHQPPIPFFAADGFKSGPTGPFNGATEGEWTAGETGSVTLAATNAPNLTAGDRVEITLLEGETVVTVVETTAG